MNNEDIQETLKQLQEYIVLIEGSHYQVNIDLWADESEPPRATPIWREYKSSELCAALITNGFDQSSAKRLISLLQGHPDTRVVAAKNEKQSLPLRPCGYQLINNVPWFLKEERNPIEAVPGNPALVLREICRMFGNEAPLFLGWLKGAYTRQLIFAATARGEEPQYKKVASQTLAIVGAPGTGKTHVLLDIIMAGVLGNYTNMPAAWLCGKSRFNDWALESNIWVADDGVALQSIKERKYAETLLKQAGYSSRLSIECKNKAEVNLDYPCERIFIVNLQDYALRALPTSEENPDKYLFLHNCAPSGLITEEEGDFDTLEQKLREAIPAFAHWLLHEYTLPAWAVQNTKRHTVTDFGYMSPAVQEALAEQDEAGILMARLRKCYMHPETRDLVRNKYQSQEELRSRMEWLESRNDCTSSTKMGILLSECIRRWPHLIGERLNNGYRQICLHKNPEWENALKMASSQTPLAQPDPILLAAAGLPADFTPLESAFTTSTAAELPEVA